MGRSGLLLLMTGAVAVATVGAGTWWLRRAPTLPPGWKHISTGMTLGEIERLLGQPLTEQESCTRGSYYLLVEDPLAGQASYIDIGTRRHRYDHKTDSYESMPREEQPCVAVDAYRWSRIGWLNEQPWARWLLGLPDHD